MNYVNSLTYAEKATSLNKNLPRQKGSYFCKAMRSQKRSLIAEMKE